MPERRSRLDQPAVLRARLSALETDTPTDASASSPVADAAASPVAVAGLLWAGAQRRLTVGAADDVAEVEAEAIANEVVGHGHHEHATHGPSLLSPRRDASAAPESAGEGIGLAGGAVRDDAEIAIQQAKGGGLSLPRDTRDRMEAAMGADFGAVRVHTGAVARSLSAGMNADAFTLGGDIFFKDGFPDTSTREGGRLVAHELAHTMQQGAATRLTAQRRIAAMATLGTPEQGTTGAPVLRRGLVSWLKGTFGKKKKSAGSDAKTDAKADAKAVAKTEPESDQLTAEDLQKASAKLSGEKVNATTKAELEEAIEIIASLKQEYGLTLSSAMTIESIKVHYSRAPDTELNKLTASTWEMKELRALARAVAHFGPILGVKRASSPEKDRAQGVTTLGKLTQTVDTNSATAKLDGGVLGEYFSKKKNVGFFDDQTNHADDRYLPKGKTRASNATTLEANAIHEMAHGLLAPTQLAAWVAALDYWADANTPSGTDATEAPPTGYGQTNANEDLCESAAIFFTNPARLKDLAPKRRKFLADMVASWRPQQRQALVAAAAAKGSS